jgi:hypothetical protein
MKIKRQTNVLLTFGEELLSPPIPPTGFNLRLTVGSLPPQGWKGVKRPARGPSTWWGGAANRRLDGEGGQQPES